SLKPVDTHQLQRIFEAARWAPSANNDQPWSFIVGIDNDETYQKIFSSLVEFNQLWVKFAPILVVSIGQKISKKSGKQNRWYSYDVGQAVAHLSIQAMHEGLFVHQIGGFDAEVLINDFEIPDDQVPISVFTIGYIGDYNELHPNLKELELKERTRKNQNDFLFSGKFGMKLSLG
ncbi:MAG: nitroreductase, partial [Lentimicrobium sp.]|nr:nitroreductase [Lentimicrobium sp.]